MVEKRIKSVIPIYGMGISFLIMSIILPPYSLISFFIVFDVSLICYLGLSKIFKGEIIYEKLPPTPVETGNKDLDLMIIKSRQNVSRLENLMAVHEGSQMSVKLSSIIEDTNKILKFAENNTSKGYKIKSFMEYYLETAMKLLDDYTMFKTEKITGENAENSLKKIESTMDFLVEAFKNKLDDLYEDKALDISADVNVMKKLLESEGLLSENQLPDNRKERR